MLLHLSGLDQDANSWTVFRLPQRTLEGNTLGVTAKVCLRFAGGQGAAESPGGADWMGARCFVPRSVLLSQNSLTDNFIF